MGLGDDAAGFSRDGLDVPPLVVVGDVNRAALLESDQFPGGRVIVVVGATGGALPHQVAGGVPVVVGRSLGCDLAPSQTVVVVGVGGYQAVVRGPVDLDELVQGVVGIDEGAVTGHVAVLIVGEAGVGDLVGSVVGMRRATLVREVAGGVIGVTLLNSAAADQRRGVVIPVGQPAVGVIAKRVSASP